MFQTNFDQYRRDKFVECTVGSIVLVILVRQAKITIFFGFLATLER